MSVPTGLVNRDHGPSPCVIPQVADPASTTIAVATSRCPNRNADHTSIGTHTKPIGYLRIPGSAPSKHQNADQNYCDERKRGFEQPPTIAGYAWMLDPQDQKRSH